MSSRKRVAYWLLASVAFITVLLLLLPSFIDSDALKAKLQSTVEQQSGGQLRYQQAELSFLPRPSVTLHQVKLDIPEQVQGTVGAIQLYPELLAILSGQLRLAKLILESPEVSLNVAGVQTNKGETPSAYTFSTLQKSLTNSLAPLAMVAPDLVLVVNKGTLTLNQGDQAVALAKSLNLTVKLTASNPALFQANLQGFVPEMTFQRDGQQISIEDLKLNGVLQSDKKKLLLSIANLSLAKPALQINGTLVSNSVSPAFEIDLRGTGIDVDATRKTILDLAGDISSIKELFSYLRGGTVPQISFHADAVSVSELGDLKKISIKGQLEDGVVSIPKINLDLTEVNGEVEIFNGVLQGTGVSTRLAGSTGHDGTVRVSLAEGSDLFQMELMLSADLSQAQHILKRIVKESELAQLADNVTNLKGTGTGKLIVGDSLGDIDVRVDISDLNLTADYQGLPFPVGVIGGELFFKENKIELKGMNGTFGNSTFFGLTGGFDWVDVPFLDLSSGAFGLVLDELYPWVASFDGTKDSLNEIKQLTGRLDLATLSIKGAVDTPASLRFAASGAIKDVAIATPRYPAQIDLSQGEFTLDEEKLTFRNLKADGLDANLSLSGSLKGHPQGLSQVELSLDGKLGQKSALWLSDTLGVPTTYVIRTPLSFSQAKVMWQPDAKTTFKGGLSVEEGPNLTLDAAYRPERLQVNRLTVSDQYSNAEIALGYGKDEINLSFNGTLKHETLQGLFVGQDFGKGSLEGDFSAKIPISGTSVPMAKGRLTGQSLEFSMPSGDNVGVEKITLVAGGSQLKADATSLSWNDLTWNPAKATIGFDQDKIEVRITESKLCGIDAQGLFTVAGKNLSLDFTLEGEGLDLVSHYSCLTRGKVKMTGTLDLFSKVTAQGQSENLSSNLRGPLNMTFTSGLIEQSKLLAQTLEVLNITEVVKGRLPNLDNAGFAYSTINLQGNFQGEKLIVNKLLMDGETLDVIGQGELDFDLKTVNLELLAAPFKTANTVVKNIPGVNYLLAGSLVTVPVSIKGDQDDPKVQVMSAASVGSSLLGLGGRILNSPLKLIETVTPGKEDLDR